MIKILWGKKLKANDKLIQQLQQYIIDRDEKIDELMDLRDELNIFISRFNNNNSMDVYVAVTPPMISIMDMSGPAMERSQSKKQIRMDRAYGCAEMDWFEDFKGVSWELRVMVADYCGKQLSFRIKDDEATFNDKKG